MVSPPRSGEESYEEYVLERDAILTSLRRRAVTLSNALNQLEGVIDAQYIILEYGRNFSMLLTTFCAYRSRVTA
jgi:hypothetical protein